jgi:hypothetical protein
MNLYLPPEEMTNRARKIWEFILVESNLQERRIMILTNFKLNKDTISVEIDGTYIDLHNLYDFKTIEYNVDKRSINLSWIKGEGEYVPENLPQSVILIFENVMRFAARERNLEIPFSEDDCVNYLGFLPKDSWDNLDGFLDFEPVNSDEHMIIEFMSGAVFKIDAEKGSCILS